jgi:hypothetical protein
MANWGVESFNRGKSMLFNFLLPFYPSFLCRFNEINES